MNESPAEITLSAYNRNAGRYADKFMKFKAYQEKIIRFQQRYIPQGAKILDIGCGPGNNAATIMEQDKTCRITGIDLSEEMIKLARTNAPGCEFIRQDIRDFKAGRRYDVIIASFCIVHLTDFETASLIKTISDMLMEKGSLYLSFMEGRQAGFETTSFSDDELFFNYYERQAVQSLLLDHDLKPLEILSEGYQEDDGTVTDDIFIFAKKSVKEKQKQ